MTVNSAEHDRLKQARVDRIPWKKWGPYLSERQWGTVREDYSDTGDAWNYFTHDQARSRAYRWGEDGLGGISDDRQILCFALALWNGKDPILKERLFGLANSEGNHGEDVKEYYYYLDSTPTHSYMKYLYKYPQQAFPYSQLIDCNRDRSKFEPEYELIDTGIFNDNKYFDVFVEYAKDTPEDILIKITAHNRGTDPATLHVLPTLWFRNTWSWGEGASKPELAAVDGGKGYAVIEARHAELGKRYLYAQGSVPVLYTENETNHARLFNAANASPYVKDGINNYVVEGQKDAVNPAMVGTKASPHYVLTLAGGNSAEVRLRLTDAPPAGDSAARFGKAFDAVLADRLAEADGFYSLVSPDSMTADEKLVLRQALSGMLWSKQFFYYDVAQWLKEHGLNPTRDHKREMRNREWYHMLNRDIISMPDKWEYPWYAAWDLAFHTIPLAMVDPDFAKDQLHLMLSEKYLHPNGQIPAYEWNFGDVNPPVHPWATWYVYNLDRELRGGEGDVEFLEEAFQKLLLNFTWWVNRKDPEGNNVFGGGFLGLDNIGVFDRSAPLPTGGHLEQSDGTAWMAFFSATMLQIALELAVHSRIYEKMALRFFEHYMRIVGAMDRIGDNNDELWDEQDGFFYDVLHFPSGHATRIKVRSMVGLLPLMATVIIPKEAYETLPDFVAGVERFMAEYPDLAANIVPPRKQGARGRHLLTVITEDKLRRILHYMLSEDEFLSPYGIRALSRYHKDHPYSFSVGSQSYTVAYEPGDSTTGMFGGNSNWRGPIWVPVNVMLIRALLSMYQYFGDDFTVECPTGSGKFMTLFQVSKEISDRLARIFLRDASGKRPVFGSSEVFQNDPLWRDHVLFYEYFNGDSGAGIGASHQTGWTGCVAKLMQLYAAVTADAVLKEGIIALLAPEKQLNAAS
jgi:hypothetical protein